MLLLADYGLWLPTKRELWRPTKLSPIRVINNKVWNPVRERFEDVNGASFEEIIALLQINQLTGFSSGGGTSITYTQSGATGSVNTAIPSGTSHIIVSGNAAAGAGGCSQSGGGGGGGSSGAYFISALLALTSADWGLNITARSYAGGLGVTGGVSNDGAGTTTITSSGTSFGNLNFLANFGLLGHSALVNGNGGAAVSATNTSTGAAASGATLTTSNAGVSIGSGNLGGAGGAGVGPNGGAAGAAGPNGGNGGNGSPYGAGGGGAGNGAATLSGNGADGRWDLAFT